MYTAIMVPDDSSGVLISTQKLLEWYAESIFRSAKCGRYVIA
jgi:hypothetical protein